MYSRILAASLLAFGLATSAVAQTPAPATDTQTPTPAPATDTTQPSSASTEMTKPKTHTPKHSAKKHSVKKTAAKMGKCGGGNQAANSSGKEKGALQTQGGMSDATPMDKKCASYNN